MAKARAFLVVVVALALGGCSALTETWDEWFGEAPPPSATPAVEREVFYARVEGLAMHALPSGSSDIVARLHLHQRVTRIGLARGYANVSTESGIVGWVDNAQLLWRLPVAPEPSAPAAAAGAAPEAAVPAAGGVATPEPPPPSLETPPAAAAGGEPTATSTPAPAPAEKGSHGVFDPF